MGMGDKWWWWGGGGGVVVGWVVKEGINLTVPIKSK